MNTTAKRPRFTSVWDAIEGSREVAASLKLRAEVASAVIEEIRHRKLTQSRAAVRRFRALPTVAAAVFLDTDFR